MKTINCEMCGKILFKNNVKPPEGLNFLYHDIDFNKSVDLRLYFPDDGDYYDDDHDFERIPQDIYDQVITAYEKKHGKGCRVRPNWCGCYSKDWFNHWLK
jgi:hypothetical protein